MRKDYEKLFTQLAAPEPSPDLFGKIMRRIHTEERRVILRWRFGFFIAAFFGSGAAFVPVFQMVRSAMAESGFLEFLSLFASDFSVATALWQNFIFVLLETLPVTSIALFLIIAFIFLESLKFAVRDVKVVFNHGFK